MSDLIETVAKAIFRARYEGQNARLNLGMTWDVLDERGRQSYLDQAEAAIAAIEAARPPHPEGENK